MVVLSQPFLDAGCQQSAGFHRKPGSEGNNLLNGQLQANQSTQGLAVDISQLLCPDSRSFRHISFCTKDHGIKHALQ